MKTQKNDQFKDNIVDRPETRVCFISSAAAAFFGAEGVTYGGSEIQLYLLARELVKISGFKVCFHVGDFEQRQSCGDGIEIYKSFSPSDNSFLSAYKYLRALIKSDANVYVQRALNRSLFLLVCFGKLFNKKIIYMVAHDGETDFSVIDKKDFISKYLYKISMRFSDIIVAQSEFEVKNLKKFFKLNGKRIFLLRKGTEVGNLGEVEPGKKKKYDAIWVGRCEPFKKPELFIDLAKNNPERKFCFICAVSKEFESYYSQIESRARALHNIDFFHRMNNTVVLNKMLEAKLFLLTSLSEGELPMTALEALASGLPLVSIFMDPDKLISKEKIGVALGGNLTKVQAICDFFWNDSSVYKLYSDAARNYIAAKRDIRVVAKNFSLIVKKLC